MHSLPALEVKRRGVAALEEALKKGPVHIIKNNRPSCVVLSEEDYAALISQQRAGVSSLWALLENRPWEGKRSKKNIDDQIHQEQDDWEK